MELTTRKPKIHNGTPYRLISLDMGVKVEADDVRPGDFAEIRGEYGPNWLGLLAVDCGDGVWLYRRFFSGQGKIRIRNRGHLEHLIEANQHPTL